MAKKMEKNQENKLQEELFSKLDIIIKLLANSVVNKKNSTESVAYLNKIGLSNKEIEEALNLKHNVVTAMLSNAKKVKVKKEKKNG